MDIRDYISLLGFEKLYVGFSGGADSTALLVLLEKASLELGFQLEAVHFEHGLRGQESVADAEWCRDFCKRRSIPFTLIELDVENRRGEDEGLEEAARRLRLDSWKEIVSGKNCAIALGHHAGDRVENLFLRLARGSNVSGLSSLRLVREIAGLTFIRPLLDFDRSQLIAFLKEEGIDDWREDASNSDNVFKRNFFRNKVLPEIYEELPYSKKGFLNSLSALDDDASFIETQAEKLFSESFTGETIDIFDWLDLHPALRPRILRMWLSSCLGCDYIPRRDLIERLVDTFSSREPQDGGETVQIPLDASLFLTIRGRSCSLLQELHDTELSDTVNWNWEKEPSISWNGVELSVSKIHSNTGMKDLPDTRVCFDADKLPDTLIVRQWQPGDRMIPFASQKPVKLKKLFTDKKIPSAEKQNYPLLVLPDETIIWTAGLRRSDFAPVDADTENIALFLKA